MTIKELKIIFKKIKKIEKCNDDMNVKIYTSSRSDDDEMDINAVSYDRTNNTIYLGYEE